MIRLISIIISLLIVATVSQATEVGSPFHPPKNNLPTLESHSIFVNEWFDAIYKGQTAKMDGAAITVGTFRAFQKVLYGNFSWMFVIDVDPMVKRFNQLNYDAVTQSASLGNISRIFLILIIISSDTILLNMTLMKWTILVLLKSVRFLNLYAKNLMDLMQKTSYPRMITPKESATLTSFFSIANKRF